MGVVVKLASVMQKRRISLGELSERVGITPANMSILKTGKGKAIRFSTLGSDLSRTEMSARGYTRIRR